MTNTAAYLIRDIQRGDAESWARLHSGYRSFYEVPADDSAVAITWGWMLGREHDLRGIVAVAPGGEVVALANLRLFARPSIGKMGLYLDDLFAIPSSRGSGSATALLARAAEIAADEGANVVLWITASDNVKARSVYDACAAATPWVTYDMKPRNATPVV